VLAVATLIMAVIFLFPPWLFVFSPPKESIYQPATRAAGYHLILSPHRVTDSATLSQIFVLGNPRIPLSVFTIVIDRERLIVQVGGLLIITALLTVLLKDRKAD